MARTFHINRSGIIQWPAACVTCKRKDDLTWADATSGRVTSVAPTLTGEVRVKSELLELHYPVCTQHAKGLAAFNFATRNTAGLRAVRILLYGFGPMSIISFVRRLIPGLRNVALPLDFAALLAAFALGFVFVLVAFWKLPVRVAKLSADEVSVRIKNDAYAAQFARLNASLLRPER